MPSPNRRVVVIQPDLWDEVTLRSGGTSAGRALDLMLRRYLEILESAGENLNGSFTPAEMDLMTGLVADGSSADILHKLGRARFRQPDNTAIAKLQGKVVHMSAAERIALTDMLERRVPHEEEVQ